MHFLINLSKFHLIFGVMGQHIFSYCDLEKTVCHNIPHVQCFQSDRSYDPRSFGSYKNYELDLINKTNTRSEELEILATILTLRKRQDGNKTFCLSSLKFVDVSVKKVYYSDEYDFKKKLEKIENDLQSFQSIGCDKSQQKNNRKKFRLCLYNNSNRSTQVEYDHNRSTQVEYDEHKMLRLHFNLNRNDITIMHLVIFLVWFGNLILLLFLYAAHRYETLRFIDRGSSY